MTEERGWLFTVSYGDGKRTTGRWLSDDAACGEPGAVTVVRVQDGTGVKVVVMSNGKRVEL